MRTVMGRDRVRGRVVRATVTFGWAVNQAQFRRLNRTGEFTPVPPEPEPPAEPEAG